MSFQTQLTEYLKENGPSPIVKIASNLGTSVGYVRTQLRALEYAGTIARVDDRTPIYYQINPLSPMAKLDKEISQARRVLMAAPSDQNDWIAKGIKKTPKANWEDMAIALEAYTAAVKQIIEQGLAVDTL